MMPDTWPETLPQCFLGGTFQENESMNNLIETSEELAVPKSRPMSSAAARKMSGQLKMTLEQLPIFRAFGRTTLVNWALPFWFPAQSGEDDPDMEGYVLVKFRKDGMPDFSKVTSKQYIVQVGFYILP